MADLRALISEATTTAMKARDKPRVAALRLINAAIKQVEVDERKDLNDDEVIAVLNRMLKQRRDSESQFRDAGRTDLADIEAFEIALIGEFMPEPLDEASVDTLIAAAIASTGAASMSDMGRVMGALRSEVQGRADMAQVSAKVKAALS
jgi:uncharacterized protein YqeY